MEAVIKINQKTFIEGYGEAEANLKTKNGTEIPMYFTSVRLK